jgi:hypothetical protein
MSPFSFFDWLSYRPSHVLFTYGSLLVCLSGNFVRGKSKVSEKELFPVAPLADLEEFHRC